MDNVAHRRASEWRKTSDPAAMPLPFGRLLKRYRLAAGFSQEALAERAGVSWRTISDLERGVKRGPRGSTLRLLADALALRAEDRAALHASAFPRDEAVTAPAVLKRPPAAVPTNLPLALTSFIGREQELETVRRLLGQARLLTLTGAGGCGKTRLALEVARALAREGDHGGASLVDAPAYPDGIWLVELAALGDGSLVPRAVTSALGVREKRDHSPPLSLITFLQARRLLLLLDNCEHLVVACAGLVDALLSGCPRLTILATSREALGIGGERTWRVRSLSLPDPGRRLSVEQALAYGAVHLFVQRAEAARPELVLTGQQVSLVAQVCRRLDGIPLAIELAAARLSALSLDQLLARLDDRFRLLTSGSRTALPRQQTLRATLDWSYGLLGEAERLLLRRLTVFAGGWTLEAAERICAEEGIAAEEVLDLLVGLVNKSLVLLEEGRTGARYRLLETVRQYGRENLVAAGEAPRLQDRHLDWYLAVAKQAEPKIGGSEQEVWLERLEVELENVRAALAWSSLEKGRQETGLRLAEALRWFWVVRGHLSEGRHWLDSLLTGDIDVALRARSLDALGELVAQQGDNRRALALSEESIVLHRRLGNGASAAHALLAQGMVHISLGDYQRATALIDEALPLLREHGERHGVGWSLHSLGVILHLQGDFTRAAKFYEESLARFQELGDTYGSSYEIANLANVAWNMGDRERAEHLYRESLNLHHSLADKSSYADCFEGLATVAVAEGQLSRAARLFGAAEGIRETLGHPVQLTDREAHERIVPMVRAALGEAAFTAAWTAGEAMGLDEAIAYALQEADPE